ncbi:MAG: flagellar hook-length control protein FliK [Gammaproteobacteria bacterium]
MMSDMLTTPQPTNGRGPALNTGNPAAKSADTGEKSVFYDALAALLGLGEAPGSAAAVSQSSIDSPPQEPSTDGNSLPSAAGIGLPLVVPASVPVSLVPGGGTLPAASDAPLAPSPDALAGKLTTLIPAAGNQPLLSPLSQAGASAFVIPSAALPAALPATMDMAAGLLQGAVADKADARDVALPLAGVTGYAAAPLSSLQASSSAPAPISTAITLPVGADGWGQELGSRVQWLAHNNVQAAELRINPPHLGPIEIRIKVDGDQTSVSFSSQHVVTRDALEAAIPRLRDMLGDNGLNLANVNVSSQSFSDQRGQQAGSHDVYRASLSESSEAVLDDSSSANLSRDIAIGLVDYYA